MNEKRRRLILYVLGGILAGFILLTILVSLFPVTFIDKEFSEELQEHQHPLLDSLMTIISWPGSAPQSIALVLSAAFIFLVFNRKREALFISLTLISGIVSSSIKILIDRPRPTDDIVRIVEIAKHQSFPSGHVLFYVLFFGFVIILMNRLKEIHRPLRLTVISLSAFLIFTVPLSRVYLGAHWFTDVLASAMLGIVLLYTLSYFYLQKR